MLDLGCVLQADPPGHAAHHAAEPEAAPQGDELPEPGRRSGRLAGEQHRAPPNSVNASTTPMAEPMRMNRPGLVVSLQRFSTSDLRIIVLVVARSIVAVHPGPVRPRRDRVLGPWTLSHLAERPYGSAREHRHVEVGTR